MRITVRSGRVDPGRKSLRVVAAVEGPECFERLLPAEAGRPGPLTKLLTDLQFRGASNETALLPHDGRWTLAVGLGKSEELSADRARQLAGTAAKVARARGFRHLVLPALHEPAMGSGAEIAQTLIEGALLGLYRYDRFKQRPAHERRRRIEALTLHVGSASAMPVAERAARKAQTIAGAVTLARDLINGPSNLVTPTHLANHARAIAKRHRLACRVLAFAQLKRLGFGGIAGVAQGSAHPAQFIILDYRPRGARRTVVLCGKGITFDSGGISLKPAAKMEQMKYDMSGAAAVLATLQAAAALQLPTHVVGLIAATENLPSGTAQKPGDVLTTLSGKTVEVLNTDAEGRLVLADCLHYAKRFKPDAVVDIATLTGACVIALGSEAIGLLATDDRLAARLEAAGRATHERLWRLPLWEEYGPQLHSEIADLRNVSTSGEAGTIMGAKFLQAFAEGMSWAHLDIAGTAWTDRERPYIPKGAVGIGVRLLVKWIEDWTS